MLSKRFILFTGFGLLLLMKVIRTDAQDVSFSQFYSNPLVMNPAFAGSIGTSRISLQYRNQWHSLSNAFDTYSIAFDIPMKKLQGGLGFFMINDSQAAGAYNTLQVNGVYSVFIRLSDKFRFHGALQGGISYSSINIDELIFADNVDINFGNHGISREIGLFSDTHSSFFDFSAGMLLYSQRFFGGMAIHHLAEPYYSFLQKDDNANRLKRKYTGHLGARLPVYLFGHRQKKFDFSPQLIVQSQNGMEQVNYGLFLSKWGLMAGSWFRQNLGLKYDAVTLLAGFMKNNWQLTYSYDIAVSGLWGNTGGTSEIAFVFLITKINPRKNLPFYQIHDDAFGIQ